MIDIQKLTKLRNWLDIALRVLEANGLPPDAKLKNISLADNGLGLFLHMKDGSFWKLGVTLHRLDDRK